MNPTYIDSELTIKEFNRALAEHEVRIADPEDEESVIKANILESGGLNEHTTGVH